MTKEKESVQKIEHIQLCDLKPYDKNPRKHDKSLPELIKSIKKFGFTSPIVIDQDNRIVAGHGRFFASEELNLYSIPCVRVTLTNDEYLKLMVADNKITELSKWNNAYLVDLLNEINTMDIPGVSDEEIDKLFGRINKEVHTSPNVADFGESGEVDDQIDPDSLVKTKSFKMTDKEFRYVTDKLRAIKKENGYDTEVEALIKALEPYKGLPKVKRRSPVKEV